jgi:hypothetical protein
VLGCHLGRIDWSVAQMMALVAFITVWLIVGCVGAELIAGGHYVSGAMLVGLLLVCTKVGK